MTEAMKITLSNQPADGRWGEKATCSINNDGITSAPDGKDDLGLIQRAARKSDGLGIKHVALSGEGWDTDRSWAFWAGYKGPKGQLRIEWRTLDEAQSERAGKSPDHHRLGARHHQCTGGKSWGRSSWRSAPSTCCAGGGRKDVLPHHQRRRPARAELSWVSIPWAAAQSVLRSCWRWTTTQPATKKPRSSPAWSGKRHHLSIPAATAA